MAAAPHLVARRLQAGDFDKGYLPLLAQLSTVGTVSRDDFASTQPPRHRTFVGGTLLSPYMCLCCGEVLVVVQGEWPRSIATRTFIM